MRTKTNREFVTLVFPRLRPFTCVYFEFSLAPCDIYLCSDWSLRLLWFSIVFSALNRKALYFKTQLDLTYARVFSKIALSLFLTNPEGNGTSKETKYANDTNKLTI